MDRRIFTQALAAATLGSGLPWSADAATAKTVVPGQSRQYPISVMLWTVFTGLPFEQRLNRVAEAGYTNVELVGEYRNWSRDDFAKANAARTRLGIEFDATAGLTHGVANPATQNAFLDELRQAMIPMETLGCPAMIVLSGNVVPGLSRGAHYASCVETLKQAATLVQGKQINGQPVRLLLECIHLEENPHYYLTSATEAIEIVREVNHPQVQFLYDIYHEQMSFGQLIEKLDKHIDVIGLIHIADVPGRHEPDTGEINYANIYRKLEELNYRHTVAMEFLPTGDEVTALKAARAMALIRS